MGTSALLLRRITVLVCVAALCGMSGCGGGGAEKTHKVTGKITTADGAAVKGAGIQFVPAGKGFSATGSAGEDGVYSLSTFAENDGAAVGDYDVSISSADGQPATIVDGKSKVTVTAGANTFDYKVKVPPPAPMPPAEAATEEEAK